MKKRFLIAFIFVIYCAILIKVMVFKAVPAIRIEKLTLDFGGTNGGHPANFVPFKTIIPYLLGEKGFIIGGLNLIGNIALLVPLGFLAPLMYAKMTWKKSLFLAIVAGLVIEGMQTVLRVGIFDIDDVILNGLGVMCGYWTYVILTKWIQAKKYITILLAASICIVVVTAVGTFSGMSLYRDSQRPINPQGRMHEDQSHPINPEESGVVPSNDPCGGTNGTGEIVSMGDNSITIKSKNSDSQVIGIDDSTMIKNSAGSLSASDLKIGDHVTIVIFDSKTATDVLVCNTSGS